MAQGASELIGAAQDDVKQTGGRVPARHGHIDRFLTPSPNHDDIAVEVNAFTLGGDQGKHGT